MKYDTRLRSSPGLLVHFEAVKEQGRGGYKCKIRVISVRSLTAFSLIPLAEMVPREKSHPLSGALC